MLGQPENNINEDVISDAVTYFQNSFPNVTHVVHSYKYDTHPQHLATGKLIYELYKNNLIYDCRFFIPPSEASYVPNELLIESTADNNLEKESVLNAVEEYKLDNQDMIREGIGFKSVPGLFNILVPIQKFHHIFICQKTKTMIKRVSYLKSVTNPLVFID